MAQLRYGYQIKNGSIVAEPDEALRLLVLFKRYLEGYSIADASRIAGINRSVSNCSAMLRSRDYLGNDHFPQLIPPDLFEQVQQEHARRKSRQKPKQPRVKNKVFIPTSFVLQREGHIAKDTSNPGAEIYARIKAVGTPKRE